MDKPLYSVVVPVYNSENTLNELYNLLKDFFSKSDTPFEIIFVEDSSKDKSWEILLEIKMNNPDDHISLIKLTKNFGQHKATLCGINASKGDYLITIDDDLQVYPDEIGKMIHTLRAENADLVYGNYRNKKHSGFRNLGSRTMNKALMKEIGYASSFRIFTREMADKILTQHRDFVNLDEMLFWFTGNIYFADVEHHSGKKNKSGYSTIGLFRQVKNVVLYSTNLPLKFMVYGGITFSFLSFFMGGYFIFRKLFYKVPMGYTSLIVAILFSTSILMLSMGVIGEYLSRIYQAQNKKPPYLIRKIIR